MKKTNSRKKSHPSLFTAAVICILLTVVFAAFWRQSIVPIAPLNISQVGVSDGSVTLEIVPSSATVEKGTEKSFTLKASVDDPKKLTGIQVEITYDQAKVGTPVVTKGDFLTLEIAPAQVKNGKITFAYGASTSSGGVTGSGTLATIKVTPPSAGTSKLEFTENTEAFVIGRLDSALKSAGNATIIAEEPVEPSGSPSSSPAGSPSPSPSPSVSPSPSATVKPASRTTTLRTSTVTCSSLSFSWDKIKDAKGYIIDLADNKDFNSKLSSGTLGSDKENYTFSNLKNGTKYYARITQTDIHDFPRYTQVGPVSTLSSCPGTVPASASPRTSPRGSVKASPKASVKASAKPSPSPSSVADASKNPESTLTPTNFTDKRFDDAQIELKSDTDDPRKKTLFARFIAWLVSLFE